MTAPSAAPGAAGWPEAARRVLALMVELAATPGPARADQQDDTFAHQSGHEPQACTVCPVCRLIARLRVVRPDLAEQLTAAADGIGAALRVLLQPVVPEGVAWPAPPTTTTTAAADPMAAAPATAAPATADPATAAPSPVDDPPWQEPAGWPSTVRVPIIRIDLD